jgi:hypothetical protein
MIRAGGDGDKTGLVVLFGSGLRSQVLGALPVLGSDRCNVARSMLTRMSPTGISLKASSNKRAGAIAINGHLPPLDFASVSRCSDLKVSGLWSNGYQANFDCFVGVRRTALSAFVLHKHHGAGSLKLARLDISTTPRFESIPSETYLSPPISSKLFCTA